jgi:hypothetical protein
MVCRASQRHITSIDFNNETTLTSFCAAAKVTPHELQTWGRSVREWGYNHDTSPKRYDPGNGRVGWLLRHVTTDCDQVDGTIPRNLADTRHRYSRAVSQGDNTCAVDVTLFCALRLDVGRTRIDQIPLMDMLALPPVASKMRETMCKFWGTEPLPVRNQMRRAIYVTLSASCPDMYAVGSLQDVKTVVQNCFEHLPRLSFTIMRTESCCDKINHIGPDTRLSRKHFLEFALKQGQSLNMAISAFFNGTGGEDFVQRTDFCSRLNHCDHILRRIRLVVDRMPHILMIGLQQAVTPEAEVTAQVLGVLAFNVYGPTGSYEVRYQAIGCIMQHYELAHFTARWRADREGEGNQGYMYYDGMDSDEARLVPDWWSESPFRVTRTRASKAKKTLGPVVIFYEKVGPS